MRIIKMWNRVCLQFVWTLSNFTYTSRLSFRHFVATTLVIDVGVKTLKSHTRMVHVKASSAFLGKAFCPHPTATLPNPGPHIICQRPHKTSSRRSSVQAPRTKKGQRAVHLIGASAEGLPYRVHATEFWNLYHPLIASASIKSVGIHRKLLGTYNLWRSRRLNNSAMLAVQGSFCLRDDSLFF